jgi:hypothetical protein
MAYEVGYGIPPKRTQFKPGQSGNPKGRPRRPMNIDTLLKEILFQQVTVTDQKRGVRRKATLLEVILQRVAQQAAVGNLKALRELLRIVDPLSHLIARAAAAPADSEELLRRTRAEVAELFVEVQHEMGMDSLPAEQPAPRKA